MNTSKSMTEGSIAKKMIFFAIPILLGNLFQQLYNVADSLIVGNFLGRVELAAVSSTGSLIFLIVGFFNGLALGAGVVISRFFGAKDYKRLEQAIHTDLAFGLVCGVLMTAIGVILAPQLLRMMGTPEDVFAAAVWYIRVYFCGSLAVVMYNVCMGILQSVGDSRHPLYYLIISSVINIVLDLILIGIFRRGVAYAALATVISQFVSVILCLRRLMVTQDVYRVYWKKIGFTPDLLREVIRIGLPSGLQNSIISIANVVVQANINAFGSTAMAGCGIYFKIEGFAFLPVTCFSMALTTFISQNLGAREFERAKKGAAFGVICGVVLTEIIGVTVFLFMPYMAPLFSSVADVVAISALQAHTEGLFYCFLAFSHLAAGVLRGAGKSTVPMFVMLAIWCVFRISYIITITHLIPDRIQMIFYAYPLTWTMSTIVFALYLWRADWIHAYEK